MEDNIQYSLSPISDDPYDNGIAYEAPQSGPKQNTPPPGAERERNYQAELYYLNTLHHQKDEEFERAKGKRTLFTILGFAIFYFVCILGVYDGLLSDYIVDQYGNVIEIPHNLQAVAVIAVIAILLAGFHFAINASVFGYLASKGMEESKILESIKNRIKETERNLRRR